MVVAATKRETLSLLRFPVSISAIGPMSPLLPAIKQLGCRHSSTLGFFPDGAFEDYATHGHLLAALVNESGLAGY
jgi:hypothetical protein